LLANHGLTQIITEATRVTENTSTLIDHAYVSDQEMLNQPLVLNIQISDHFPTCIKFNGRVPSKQHHTIKYRSMTMFDKDDFVLDIQYAPWHVIEIFDDPNDALGYWLTLFLEILERHAPLREKRVKYAKFPDWWTPDITDAIRARDSTD